MNNEPKQDYNDLIIVPSIQTSIRSRKREVFPYYVFNGGYHLPLITAPMDTVVDNFNSDFFITNKINICYPRSIKIKTKSHPSTMQFESISLSDFEKLILEKNIIPNSIDGKYYVCIDIANGHMKVLHDLVHLAKNRFGNKIVIMTGNIANPETYKVLSESGADYIRVGIGNGNGCLTTENTGIGYPAASLIKECYSISCYLKNPAKIVADGGINTYSDILKALALGADYVMMGSVFNRALESCGDTYWGPFKINQYGKLANWLFKNKFTLKKKFRGMSTKEVQKKWGKEEFTTSEGVTRIRKVEYKLYKWTDNLTDYLKSNMSYCNAKYLSDYIGKPILISISEKSYKRFNK